MSKSLLNFLKIFMDDECVWWYFSGEFVRFACIWQQLASPIQELPLKCPSSLRIRHWTTAWFANVFINLFDSFLQTGSPLTWGPRQPTSGSVHRTSISKRTSLISESDWFTWRKSSFSNNKITKLKKKNKKIYSS